MTTPTFTLHRDHTGRLVLTDADGQEHPGVLPVRAFPLAAPNEALALVDAEGRELAWVPHLDDLSPAARALVEEALAPREFTPEILRLERVSSVVTPCTWHVDTDRGRTSFVLKAEEDIRRLPDGALLITSAQGLHLRITDRHALDRASRKLLDRFL